MRNGFLFPDFSVKYINGYVQDFLFWHVKNSCISDCQVPFQRPFLYSIFHLAFVYLAKIKAKVLLVGRRL